MNPSSRIGSRVAFALACAALFAVALPAVRARGSDVTVAASLADPSVEAGQPTEYHIDVINGRTEHPPPAPVVDGLTITYTGQSSSRQINFGNGFQMQQTVTTTYVYSVETSRAGHFTIPGQQIEVGGTDLRTLPITLTVLDAGGGGAEASGQSLAAELIIPQKSAYVGESIPAEVRTYFGLALRFNPDPDPILNGEGFSAQKFTKPRTIETQVVEGTQVHSVSYKTAITGVKLGTLSVGPVELQPVVQAPRPRQRRRGFNNPFDDPFFNNALDGLNMAPPRQVKLRTGTATVEIKPLPPGKPADFSGAIGTFRLEAEADPRKAQAGDPVTVRLVLSGQGNFDRIAAPTLSDEHGLRTYPANSKFKADDEVNRSGVKTFEQVVIPDGARSALPPYHFSYLDPATGKYVVIDTPPIPVEITGGTVPPRGRRQRRGGGGRAHADACAFPSAQARRGHSLHPHGPRRGPVRRGFPAAVPPTWLLARAGRGFAGNAGLGGAGNDARPGARRTGPPARGAAPPENGTPARAPAGGHRPGRVLCGRDAVGAPESRRRRRRVGGQFFGGGRLPGRWTRRAGGRLGGGNFPSAR